MPHVDPLPRKVTAIGYVGMYSPVNKKGHVNEFGIREVFFLILWYMHMGEREESSMTTANPYDKAYELARALQNSDEMKGLQTAWHKASQHPDHRRILEQYRQIAGEVQALQMQGRKPRQEMMNELNRLMDEIRSDPQLFQYMEAEVRVGQLMTDIMRILGEPLQEIHKQRAVD